jgi:hypothetical protein
MIMIEGRQSAFNTQEKTIWKCILLLAAEYCTRDEDVGGGLSFVAEFGGCVRCDVPITVLAEGLHHWRRV